MTSIHQNPKLAAILVGMLIGAVANQAGAADAPATFTLKAVDSRLTDGMPLIYTAKAFGCTGGNTSPALQWTNVPAGTKSLVVTLFDPDERSTPSGWWHWVVYDLPPATTTLAQGAGAVHSRQLPPGTRQGRTDLGEDAYHGPCPAKGDPPHRYVFTVYAVDVAKLPVANDSSGGMVVSVVQDHLVGKAEYVAHYGR